MKTTAILVAVAMIAMATPTYAVEKENNDLEALRASILHAAQHQDVDVDVYDADFTAALAPVLAVAEERGISLADVLNAGEETGGFPQVSDYFALIEIGISTANLCPAPTAVDNPAPGNMPWSWGGAEYVGIATSEASTAGSGTFIDATTGKAFSYSQVVTYGGVSDFYCYGFDFFGIFYTINFPYVTGLAIDG